MPASGRRLWFIGVFSLALLTTVRTEGCRVATDSFPATGTGTIEVVTSTLGEDIDPDGYTVAITDELGRTRTRSIGTEDRVRFSTLEAALEHTVELLGVEPNCEVIGADAIAVFLEESETAVLAFDVVCTALRERDPPITG